jgi:outer membrane protein assembly factor BamE (lipoprotein component of BamABCDE complex)
MNRIFAATLCALSLVGCVSSGTKVTPEQVAQFQQGKTTLSEVVATLGAPNSTTNLGNGQTILVYVHISSQANAATYVPVVGLLAGGATGTSNTATFTFDSRGILISSGSSQSNTAVNTGLLNQK